MEQGFYLTVAFGFGIVMGGALVGGLVSNSLAKQITALRGRLAIAVAERDATEALLRQSLPARNPATGRFAKRRG